LEIPQRHFAVSGLLRSVPKKTFVGEIDSLAALQRERTACQHDREQQNVPRITNRSDDDCAH